MPRAMQTSRRRGASSRRSRTSRAQLTFSVSLVERHLREGGHGPRLSETAPIFLTAILEFLVRSLLEQAKDEAQRRGAQSLITPQLLEATVYSNALLGQLLQSIIIPQVAPPEAHRSRQGHNGP
ncbi:histone H2A-Bbd type 2/3-like [Acomys russatus]|uniref:histone H2A-Bbd type 2/3-like n=1 Tax=Acomys russatus TaxID=60746 RepID=UPI0021E334D6|nr:histone H2A-Bbd type 2/3-like [Acomys russatus]